jgi:hypothetical protein
LLLTLGLKYFTIHRLLQYNAGRRFGARVGGLGRGGRVSGKRLVNLRQVFL